MHSLNHKTLEYLQNKLPVRIAERYAQPEVFVLKHNRYFARNTLKGFDCTDVVNNILPRTSLFFVLIVVQTTWKYFFKNMISDIFVGQERVFICNFIVRLNTVFAEARKSLLTLSFVFIFGVETRFVSLSLTLKITSTELTFTEDYSNITKKISVASLWDCGSGHAFLLNGGYWSIHI